VISISTAQVTPRAKGRGLHMNLRDSGKRNSHSPIRRKLRKFPRRSLRGLQDSPVRKPFDTGAFKRSGKSSSFDLSALLIEKPDDLDPVALNELLACARDGSVEPYELHTCCLDTAHYWDAVDREPPVERDAIVLRPDGAYKMKGRGIPDTLQVGTWPALPMPL